MIDIDDQETAVLCALISGLARLDSEAQHRIVNYANRWLREHDSRATDLIVWYLAVRQVARRGAK